MYYINVFFLYSILGHFIESFFYFLGSGESGFLYGAWTPIYGIGTIFLFFSYKQIGKWIHKKQYQRIALFWIGFFFLTLIELLGGILIEKIFHKVFWDYSKLPFHLGHYISLEMAFVWGISAVILTYLKPFTDKIIQKIPRFITWIAIFLFSMDLLFTLFMKV